MKLFLDDIRNPPDDSWTVVRSFVQAANTVILAGDDEITDMSLDHDLGVLSCDSCTETEIDCLGDSGFFICGCNCHKEAPSGMDFLKWIHEHQFWPTNKPTVHSANPVGARNMREYIDYFGPYNGKEWRRE